MKILTCAHTSLTEGKLLPKMCCSLFVEADLGNSLLESISVKSK